MYQSGAVLQIRIVAQDEAHRFASVENMTAVSDDAVDQLDSFSDLGRLLGAGVDRQVFQLVRALGIAMRADFHILENSGILDHALIAYYPVEAATRVKSLLGYLFQLFQQ